MAQIVVDGTLQEATAGERLIDAINSAGAHLPQVCYHPQLGPITNQRHLHRGDRRRTGSRLRDIGCALHERLYGARERSCGPYRGILIGSCETVRAIRSFLLLTKVFAGIPPDVLSSLVRTAPEGAEREKAYQGEGLCNRPLPIARRALPAYLRH